MDANTAKKPGSKTAADRTKEESGRGAAHSIVSENIQPALKLRAKPRSRISAPNPHTETAEEPPAPKSRTSKSKTFFYAILATLVVVEIGLFIAIQHYALSPWFYAPVTAIGSIAIAVWAIEHFATPSGYEDQAGNGDKRVALLAERLEALEDQSWEIRESEEIHRSLAEAFGDVVLHRTQAGIITFSNGPYQRYFSERAILPGPQMPSAQRDTDSDIPKQRDIQLNTLIGPRWFSWMDIITRDPTTGEMGIRSVARDITERKNNERAMMVALEKAKVASDAKSRFLAMVSHEIRTPLNGVLGMAQLLEDTELDPAQSNYVSAINTSGKALLGLIEDLLDSARIEAGQFALQPQPTELRPLVENVAEILAPKAGDKSVAIATHIGPSVPRRLHIDAGRMRQVLLNLAGNAMKFTEQGGVGIFVRMEKPGFLTFTIADTGPGLSAEDQERVFKEFVQTDAGDTRNHGGAGLGLSISRNIVSLMGGDIAVRSALGAGAEFSFDIPVRQPDNTAPEERPLASLSVVLVMAHSPASIALAKTLTGLGAEVDHHASLDKLLANSAKRYSAVIIDAATTELEQINLHGRFGNKPKIIALAHVEQSGRVAELTKRGFDGWLTFPVRAKSLEKVLLETTGLFQSIGISGADSERQDVFEDSDPQNPLEILLAEDNPVNALLAKSLLTKLGHRVTHVSDGHAACCAFSQAMQESSPFDIVLMDLQMPVIDGRTAIDIIRKFERRLSTPRTPVIVLTADGQEEVRNNVMATGADGLLTKPLDLKTVRRLISAYAQQKMLPA